MFAGYRIVAGVVDISGRSKVLAGMNLQSEGDLPDARPHPDCGFPRLHNPCQWAS